MVTLNIIDLNEDVLIKIFDYCGNDLENLYLTCKTFRLLIANNNLYKRLCKNYLMSGWKAELNNKRSLHQLSYRNRIKIHKNWVNGRYKEYVYFKHRNLYGGKIFLDSDTFYISHNQFIRFYRKAKNEPLERRYIKEITSSKSDVSDFTKKDNYIFAGQICGNCFLYDLQNNLITEQRLHTFNEYLMSVDFYQNIFLTSTDKKAKLWMKNIELGMTEFELLYDYEIGFKSIKLSTNGEKAYGGIYSDIINRRALREIDVETGFHKILNSDTISIYDIKLKDNNCILSGHFDTTLRLFDTRSNRDELIFIDPYDSSIYCLEYDGNYGVICGMKYHSRVTLFDLRVPNKFIQMYFPIKTTPYRSPVYSVTADSRYLYLKTDHDLRIMDFTASWAPSKDFRNIFANV